MHEAPSIPEEGHSSEGSKESQQPQRSQQEHLLQSTRMLRVVGKQVLQDPGVCAPGRHEKKIDNKPPVPEVAPSVRDDAHHELSDVYDEEHILDGKQPAGR